MLQIQTNDYIKSRKIQVDGKDWEMFPPGAGDELAMSQAYRRGKRIEDKIKSNTATDADYDLADELEKKVYHIFEKIFRDGTEDNHEVKKWVRATPLSVLQAIFEDIKKQSEDKDNEAEPKPTEAS